MKTIEEKAKAYDEALARANELYNRGYTSITGEIFPELAENKDERIRKALKQYFVNSFQNNGVAAICGVHVKDVLDWLEKQGQVKKSFISQHENRTCKENDDSLTSEDEMIRKALLEMVHDTTGDELLVDYGVHKEEALDWLEKQGEHATFRNKIQVGDKVTRNEAGVLVNLSQLKRVAKPSEKQGEQKFEMKTAEESLGIDSDTYNKIVDECLFGEQKQEWSEEDEINVYNIIHFLEEPSMLENNEPCKKIVIDWLKSLKQRIQKGE